MADPQAPKKTLSSARPSFSVGGKDAPDLASHLVFLVVLEDVQGLYRCEVRFGNWGARDGRTDFLYFDRKTLDFGKAFQVILGADTLFEGRIIGLEAYFPEGAPPELTVLAEDRFQDLRMTRRTRSFLDLSDSAVVSQIANDHGLTPSINVVGQAQKVISQVNQSDLAFLRDRMRAIDVEVWMDGNTLNAQPRTGRGGGTLTLTYQDELREFSVLADLAHQRSSVAVNGWDVSSKSAIHAESSDSTIKGELNGDQSGANILASALGTRKESLTHTVPFDVARAQAEADSFFRLAARRFVTGRGVARPDGKIRVGATVDLQRLGPLFSGKYYVSEVRHVFDGSGLFRSEFKAERPGLGQP